MPNYTKNGKRILPISSFVAGYTGHGRIRMHMPGHKGRGPLKYDNYDITEVKGADYLYEASGIIRESEEYCAELFNTRKSCYSTEGTSHTIKAMLAAIKTLIGPLGKIAAARNCHRAFTDGCILLDIDPVWIYPSDESASLTDFKLTPEDVAAAMDADKMIVAVYITTPDYRGNMLPVHLIAREVHKRGNILIVDNAHGSYLMFTDDMQHPIVMGADMCCDSLHKTLPALTGASVLHIAERAPKRLDYLVKTEMALFGSTSPSYLIMQSIEECLREIENGLPARISALCSELRVAREQLRSENYVLIGDEPMKLTVSGLARGYTGYALADCLRSHKIEPEYADEECVILMPSPYNHEGSLEKVVTTLMMLPPRDPVPPPAPVPILRNWAQTTMTIAYHCPIKRIATEDAVGQTCARPVQTCQPSVPLIVCGENFTEETVELLLRFGVKTVCVTSIW